MSNKPFDLGQYIISEDIQHTVWSNHVEQWVYYAKSNNVLIVKYKDVLSNPFVQIQIILNFLDVTNIDNDHI